jgi:hypothetical protein
MKKVFFALILSVCHHFLTAQNDSIPFPKHRFGIGLAGGYLYSKFPALPAENLPKQTNFVYVIEPRIIYRPYGNFYVGIGYRTGEFLQNGQKSAPNRKGLGFFARYYDRKSSEYVRFLSYKKRPFRFRVFYQGAVYFQNIAYQPGENIYQYRFYEKSNKPEISIGAGLNIRIKKGFQTSIILEPTYWPTTGKFQFFGKNITLEYFF